MVDSSPLPDRMPSFSLVEDHVRLIDRLTGLSGDCPPLWGRLDAAGTLAHCRRVLDLPRGREAWRRGLLAWTVGGWLKRRYVRGAAPFPRGPSRGPRIPNPLLAPRVDAFETERRRLVSAIEEFVALGPGDLPHPLLGAMTPADWDRLQWKHLDHHLRQFGR